MKLPEKRMPPTNEAIFNTKETEIKVAYRIMVDNNTDVVNAVPLIFVCIM